MALLDSVVAAPPTGAAGCAGVVGAAPDGAEQHTGALLLPEGSVPEGTEQQSGTIGFGAETPAISEPRPSFCSVGASSLPVESRPLADWNFCSAATVSESHLPFGSLL